MPELYELAERDFKLAYLLEQTKAAYCNTDLSASFIIYEASRSDWHSAVVQLAAWSTSVLKALEQHGIYIDMLAGTSAGALTGTVYAAGFDPDYITACFRPICSRLAVLSGTAPVGAIGTCCSTDETGSIPLRKYLDLACGMEQLILPTLGANFRRSQSL